MDHTSVINSSGGFKNTQNVPLVKHDGFNIGYVGTLGYVKLYPEFMDYCEAVSDIPDVKFIMIGRIPEPNLVLRDAKERALQISSSLKGGCNIYPQSWRNWTFSDTC